MIEQTTSRPTSLSDAGVQLSSPPEARTSSSTHIHDVSSLTDSQSVLMSDDEKRCDENTRAKSRMEKYFAEKPDKNIFMKLIHPSYHERNLQFRKLFVEKGLIDENDQFLASYSCAYQREILAQGRMFISQFNVCFYANIIGWETTLVIPMKEIRLIKKMKAAFIFPNSIQFERDTSEKYFFASFINRDKSFQVLTTAHEKVLNEGRAMTREEVWDMVYNTEDKEWEVLDAEEENSQTPAISASPDGTTTPASVKNQSTENMTVLSPRSPMTNGSSMSDASTVKNVDKDNHSQTSTSTGGSSEFDADRPQTARFSSAEPFEDDDVVVDEDTSSVAAVCPCAEHTGRLLMDREYGVSVEKFYELLFTDSQFLADYNVRLRVAEYVAATWVRDHRGENTRTCTYTITLSNPLAPKAIIVNEKQVLTHYPNPRHGLNISKETQNSGAPYAEYFTVNCNYCITRTGARSCRVVVHGGIKYKEKPFGFIRKFIDSNTHGGLDTHYDVLQKMMDEYCQQNPDGGSPPTVAIPFLKPSSSTKSKRAQNGAPIAPQLSSSDRLLAGGEQPKSDELAPRHVAELSPPVFSATPTNSADSPDYKPFLMAIIGLLTAFFIVNLYILNGFRAAEPAAVSSKKEENLVDMIQMLAEQVRELKQKIDTMKKSEL